MNPLITYTPRPGEERRFRQFLRDDITVSLDRIYRRDQYVCLYPAYDGCEHEVALHVNRWSNNHTRHLRAQFACEPYEDKDGRKLLKLFRVNDVPKGYRIKSEPFETYCRDIRKLNALTGNFIRVPLEDSRLLGMFKLSAESYRSQHELPAISYEITEEPAEGFYTIKVSRKLDPSKLVQRNPAHFLKREFNPNTR